MLYIITLLSPERRVRHPEKRPTDKEGERLELESNVFLKVDKQQVGPVSTEELRQMLNRRRLKPGDMIWDNQQEQWLPLTESELIKELLLPGKAPARTILAIGGGKGGVGKTSLTVSIAVALAGFGNKVVVVDADLGGSNLHHYLGIQNPPYTFFDFYTMNKESLSEIVLPTYIDNLSFISGACGTLGLANPKYMQKVRFIRQLHQIEADFILLDLGAGSSFNVIDFFLAAGDGVIISSPEPASVQETFHFLQMALSRKLARTFANHPLLSPLFTAEDSVWNRPDKFSIKKLYQEVEKLDKDSASIFRGLVQNFQPKLILNMVMHAHENHEGLS